MTQLKPKEYYTVVVEALVPSTLKFKVYAETPEEALEQVVKLQATLLDPPRPRLTQMKKLNAKVYKFGSNMMELMKRF